MQNYVKISENSVKNLEILLNISRVFCKLVDLGSLMFETHWMFGFVSYEFEKVPLLSVDPAWSWIPTVDHHLHVCAVW